MPRTREPTLPGEESVWDYPRPPALERTERRIVVEFAGEIVADTTGAYRVVETSHPPTYYLPPRDVRTEILVPDGRGSWCEWKGEARYWTIRVGDRTARRAVWSYPEPTERFRPMTGYLAFYADRMDRCTVDGIQVVPQPGGFYGGWITPGVKGPFKGAPGTAGW